MLDPESYHITIALFPRFLGLIYFFAFGAFLFQIKGLLCKNGILPISDFLEMLRERLPRRCYYLVPTLFWLNASDKMIVGLIIAGTVLSVALMGGLYPWLILLLLYILYL